MRWILLELESIEPDPSDSVRIVERQETSHGRLDALHSLIHVFVLVLVALRNDCKAFGWKSIDLHRKIVSSFSPARKDTHHEWALACARSIGRVLVRTNEAVENLPHTNVFPD